MKKLDVNDYRFARLILILLLYLMKCRSRSLAVYSNKLYWVGHASAQLLLQDVVYCIRQTVV